MNFLHLSVTLLATCLCCCYASNLDPEDMVCSYTDTFGKVLSVQVDNCESLPCDLYRNSTVGIYVEFTSPNQVDNVTLNVYAKSYVTFDFVKNADVCEENYNLDCPLKANQTQTFEMKVDILSYYPKWSLSVFAELVDGDSGEDIVCICIKVKIQ